MQCYDGTHNNLCGGANNHPLRGGKFSNFQGGIKVTSMVSGGRLPEARRGQVEHGMLHLADWLQTFCEAADIKCHDDAAAKAGLPPMDSLSMWPLLMGTNSTSPRTDYPITAENASSLIRWPYRAMSSMPSGLVQSTLTPAPLLEVLIHLC